MKIKKTMTVFDKFDLELDRLLKEFDIRVRNKEIKDKKELRIKKLNKISNYENENGL